LKILVLTFYYEPDFCAGSFRSTALVATLRDKLDAHSTIEVISAMPNRYREGRFEAAQYEKHENVLIQRISMPKHNGGFLGQIIAFGAYWKGVHKLVKHQKYDLIYASSARLFTGFLAAKIANQKQTPLFLDLRDILSDSIKEVFKSRVLKAFLSPIIQKIEKYTIQSATHLNLVSAGFKDSFPYFTGKTTFLTNGIDDMFLVNNFEQKSTNNPKIITYAGNIGEGQGLEKIIPEVAKALQGKYIFKIIGDGGTKQKLVNKIGELKINNVELIRMVKRKELLKHYRDSDFLFLHLNNYKAFEKVLPSKIFEYGATNKPIIAGVNGYAREFLAENLSDTILFQPSQVQDFIQSLELFQPQPIDRAKFIQEFNRNLIAAQLADSLLELLPK
jgi:glycosyltransferase involved in cell wall biosynthesis